MTLERKVKMFCIGEYAVYGSGEICLIAEKTERSFDGIEKNEYYKLVPINTANSAYYVPVNGIESKIRRLLTKSEIYEIIDSIPQTEGVWYGNQKERKSYFEAVLKSDDLIKIIGMIKAIYHERQKRSADGKKTASSDEKAFLEAKRMLHNEFAFVLGINTNEVEDFIQKRINSME